MKPSPTAIFTLAGGVARRHLSRVIHGPYLLVPQLLFPLLLFAAFAGGVSAVAKAPNFNYFNYTTFLFVYVLLQAAGAGGVQVGIAVANDFESGFARRMLASTPQRTGLLLGYVLSGLVAWIPVTAVLTAVAVASGARFAGSVPQLATLYGIAALFNVGATLYASGLALRAQSTSVGPAMQLPIMLPMFLAPAFTTRALMSGWLRDIANFNPVTTLLEAGRGLAEGKPVSVAIAFGILGLLVAVMFAFALTGLRRAESGGEKAARPKKEKGRPLSVNVV